MAVVFVVLHVRLTKQRDPRTPVCRSVAGVGLVLGPKSLMGFLLPFFFLFFFLKSGRLLAQFELEGGDLHGIQADGGVVGQGRAGVHQSQRNRLEQLQVQVPEESRYTQLQREKHEC